MSASANDDEATVVVAIVGFSEKSDFRIQFFAPSDLGFSTPRPKLLSVLMMLDDDDGDDDVLDDTLPSWNELS